jgi:hypothetical protein
VVCRANNYRCLIEYLGVHSKKSHGVLIQGRWISDWGKRVKEGSDLVLASPVDFVVHPFFLTRRLYNSDFHWSISLLANRIHDFEGHSLDGFASTPLLLRGALSMIKVS